MHVLVSVVKESMCCSQIYWDMASHGGMPLLWSAEEPNLYVLVLTLVDKDGEHLESESAQVRSTHCLCCCQEGSSQSACYPGLGQIQNLVRYSTSQNVEESWSALH